MIGYKIYYVSRLCLSGRSIAHNGSRLCAVWEIEKQNLNYAEKFI